MKNSAPLIYLINFPFYMENATCYSRLMKNFFFSMIPTYRNAFDELMKIIPKLFRAEMRYITRNGRSPPPGRPLFSLRIISNRNL